MTTFTHHPRKPEGWAFDPDRTYSQDKSRCKPTGFWLSVDDDWRRWNDGEGCTYADADPVAFDVDPTRCLWLRNVDDLDRFTNDYARENAPWRYGRHDFYSLDWAPLTDLYAGIIIAPYQWGRRLDGEASGWYYTWDCASACIWDLSAISLADVAVAS